MVDLEEFADPSDGVVVVVVGGGGGIHFLRVS